MKERNDKDSWAAYEEEGKKLIEETLKKKDAILRKYRNILYPSGLDNACSSLLGQRNF